MNWDRGGDLCFILWGRDHGGVSSMAHRIAYLCRQLCAKEPFYWWLIY